MKTLHLSIITIVGIVILTMSFNEISAQTIYSPPAADQIHVISGTGIAIHLTWYDAYPLGEGGEVTGISVNNSTKTLHLSIHTKSDGSIMIELPRKLIDSKNDTKDIPYVVLLDGKELQYRNDCCSQGKYAESGTSTTGRILQIPFYNGSKEIDIAGTQVIPEFPFAVPVMLIGIISGIAFYRMKFGK